MRKKKQSMLNLKPLVRLTVSKYRTTDRNDEITHYPMCALTLAAITARIFYFIVIDAPETENSGWLAALLGAALSLPSLICAYYLMKKNDSSLENGVVSAIGKVGYRLLCAALSFALTYETSALFTILTSSGAYATLYNMHKLLLLVPTSLAVIYASIKGGNGIGGAAEVWLRIYLVLYAVIFFLEYETMNVSYIFPVLGPGVNRLFKSALSISMYFSLIPISFLLETGYKVAGRNKISKVKPESILIVFLLCVFVTVLSLLIHSTMYPHLKPFFQSRSSGMDLMLSNGRSNRTVQLPILIMWFSALAFSCSYMLFCAGRLMNIALSEKGTKCMVLLGLIAMVIALFRLSTQTQTVVFSFFFGPLMSLVFLALAVISILRVKRSK